MELPQDISSCHSLLRAQQAQIEQLLSKVADLEARLNKNSRNSNKPPSSDGLSKKPVRRPAFSRKRGKQSGGQPGHKGKTLEISSSPDQIEAHLPERCSCGSILDKSGAAVLEVRQVFDLPAPKLAVTEHRKLGCNCDACGTYHQGVFPPGVSGRVQYGEGVKALVVLLNVWFKLPLKKIRTLFDDLYGYALNESTIVEAQRQCYEQLASSEAVIKKSLLDSMVAHFDETGMRVAGKLHWLHVCCNSLFTYLFIHAKRGKKALWDAASVLPDFRQYAIHDCWSSYFHFSAAFHGLCGAHILRELKALKEKGTQWASWFERYLLLLYRMSDQGKAALKLEEQQKALQLFDKIWQSADKIEPLPQKAKSKKGRPKATKGRNLLIRLKKHQEAVLAFALEEEIPFTNNQAERDLRPAKTKQKVAGSFRTLEGAKRYARIHAFVSTTRKHNLKVFEQLKAAFSGNTFLTLNDTC